MSFAKAKRRMATGGRKSSESKSDFWLPTGFPSDFPYRKQAEKVGIDDHVTVADNSGVVA